MPIIQTTLKSLGFNSICAYRIVGDKIFPEREFSISFNNIPFIFIRKDLKGITPEFVYDYYLDPKTFVYDACLESRTDFAISYDIDVKANIRLLPSFGRKTFEYFPNFYIAALKNSEPEIRNKLVKTTFKFLSDEERLLLYL